MSIGVPNKLTPIPGFSILPLQFLICLDFTDQIQ